MIRRVVLAAAICAAASGCGKSRAAEGRGGVGATAVARPPALLLSLLVAADERAVDVEIQVTGPDVAAVRTLRATRGWAGTHPLDAVRSIEVRDGQGSIGVGTPVQDEAFLLLPLARAPSGETLTVRYTAQSGAEASRFALHRGTAGVSGVGHSFLVRPAMARALPFSLRFQSATGNAEATFATSLDGRTEASVEDLAEAVYVAGGVRTEKLATGERATTAFGAAIDARAATALATEVRAAAARAFGLEEGESGGPLALFVIGERGLGKAHDGAALGGALALWLDAERALDDGAKILIAHEALHRFFGSAIRLVENGREATWFSEGFATHYARRVLFEQGKIDAAAFALDVARGDDDRAGKGDGEDPRKGEYGRGARYAALLDVAVRARSQGKRSLDGVVRALALLARKAPGTPLQVSALRSIVAAHVGDEKEHELWDGLVATPPEALPDDAYGPCFRRKTGKREVFELGFDPASLSARPQLIRGTVAGSAAARAGVHDGALVLRSNLEAGREIDATFTIELVLAGTTGKTRVRYKPSRIAKTSVFQPQACKRK